ncbi:MAG TPA: 3-hydroxybutyryl-CoA dehydrogenase [Elusimicrobia bacterium]|nr:MAG: 3-hydroxybutyryl-CoA dehydrogenase [Elusimicrobia bacterium GWA2_66_18]OGR74625.1 MAG: 3-hydroxybutyryl-CoA dehydrogenase [Elusimicrobia bacterium GWC2_65_9]HAZ09158.1 3-hydroxybutyryl-CoA dehydrogenase [Elusimicrobiota bacterium]
MDIKRVCVVGGGTMGNGIAHVFALKDFEVTLVEAKKELADKALAVIARNLDRQVAKGAVTAAGRDAALARIKPALSPKEAPGFQFAVEAVSERMELKKSVFRELDAAAAPGAILATNTSSLAVTEIAASVKDPSRVIGMHFMNPVPVMKLVELIRGLQTSDETYQAARELSIALGKTPASAKDFPGFISNRVLMPMINEAIFCLMEGVSTKEDIDAVMKLGMAHPMGPLQLADYIGLDVCLAIMEVLHQGFCDSKYRPCPLLRQMVQAGRLGVKSGSGFYDYPGK